MGFWNRLFGRSDDSVSDEIKRARERHGIETGEEDAEKEDRLRELDKERKSGWEVARDEYDPWEDLKNIRANFWIGGWAAKRLRWRPNHDKLREELEEVARKREEKEQQKLEKAETRGDAGLRARLEEVERKRDEKERQKREKRGE
jgi:hypothetical protein